MVSSAYKTRQWAFIAHNLRYLSVGATCALINNLLLIGLVFAGLSATTANVVALIPMLFIGYGLHVFVTFESRPSFRGFARFSIGLMAALPLSILTLFILVDCLHLSIVLAAPIGTLLVFVWTYAATHLAIMKSRGRATFHQ